MSPRTTGICLTAFAILAGNAYAELYQQQESIFFALFQEVSEAKSLLEQTTLVCQEIGRAHV
jgi:hypothetical protein